MTFIHKLLSFSESTGMWTLQVDLFLLHKYVSIFVFAYKYVFLGGVQILK
jgi:hypothetical protein